MKLMLNDFIQYWAITTTDGVKGLIWINEKVLIVVASEPHH